MVSSTPSATSKAATSRAALAGIGLMLAGIFMFAVNDAMGKWLVATYTVGQVLLIRSLAALALLLPFIWRDRATFATTPRWGIQALRVVFATVEVACFYWAVTYLPLADVMTYYLAGPIFVTAIAGTLLREPVGWRRWTAVVVGFCGVVVALRPGTAALSWPSLRTMTSPLPGVPATIAVCSASNSAVREPPLIRRACATRSTECDASRSSARGRAAKP